MMKPRLAATTYGFTLLEMLLVVFLMGMLAVAATAMVDGFDDQQRFELTRSRLAQIRMAVIGDASRTLNGERELSGFVADMGRLPNDLQELVELTGTPWGDDVLSYQGLSDVSPVNIELYGGWRGPYLDALPAAGISAVRAFRDGWGNPDNAAPDPNFGWNVTSASSVLQVQSFGADGPAGTGTDVYEVDYPASGNLVDADDYRIDLSGVSFNVTFSQPPAANQGPLRLRLYYLVDGVMRPPYESADFTHGVSSVSSAAVFQSVSQPLPMGKHAVLVVCDNGNADVTDDRVYDGDCNGNNLITTPYYFNLVPRTQLPTIRWNIQ